jgi:hypothetical protein
MQYADDTVLISHSNNLRNAMEQLESLVEPTVQWFHRWRLKPNPKKSQLLIFHHKISENSPTITMCGTKSIPCRVVYIDAKLNFNKHTDVMKQNVIARAKDFRSLTYKNRGINNITAAKIYKMLCRPMLEYGALLLLKTKNPAKRRVEVAETTCLRKITKMRHPNNPLHNSSNALLYNKLAIEPIAQRIVTRLKMRFAAKKSNFEILSSLALNFDIDGKEHKNNLRIRSRRRRLTHCFDKFTG